MTIPQDSSYRRAIDYGVFVVLVLVFAVAVIRRVYRSVNLDQTLVVTRSPSPHTQPTATGPGSEPKVEPPKRRRRLEDDRLTAADLEPAEEPVRGEDAARPAPAPPALEIRINPNTATWWELAELPGIGEVKGRAIVAFRERFRAEALRDNPRADPPPAFRKPEDLEAVKGIGPATVEKMRPMLTFDAPTSGISPER